MGNKQGSCRDCHKPYTEVKPRECPLCHGQVCNYCIQNPLLLEADVDSMKITMLCRTCFRENADLDFTNIYEIVGEGNPHTIIWLHGGGSCRKMFSQTAKFLQEKGYRSILVDLPGHGALMDQELTLEACIDTIYSIRRQHCKEPPILVGGSLGGYIAMELIGRYPSSEDFKAAIVMMCGQNVGEGRTWKASLGLWGMGKAIKYISSQKLVSGLVKSAKNVQKPLLASILRAGYYFQQGDRQIEILKSSNPEPSLSKFEGRVLFINGSQDHRDSETRWKSSCKFSELIVYSDADHFFSHDKRFVDRLNQDILKFAASVYASSSSNLHEETAQLIKGHE